MVKHSQPASAWMDSSAVESRPRWMQNESHQYSFRCSWYPDPHRRHSPMHHHHRTQSSTMPVRLIMSINRIKAERHNNRIQGNEHNLIVDQFTSIPTAAMTPAILFIQITSCSVADAPLRCQINVKHTLNFDGEPTGEKKSNTTFRIQLNAFAVPNALPE